MQRRVVTYVTAICGLALVATSMVLLMSPSWDPVSAKVAASFAALGVMGTVLVHTMGAGRVYGSTSHVPFVAAVGLSPSWATAIAVALAAAVAEFLSGRERIKKFFNVGQITLGISVALLIYMLTADGPMVGQREFWSLPLAASTLCLLSINSLAVSGAIAVSEGIPFWQIWRKNTTASIAYDFLAIPVVFMFVYAYNWAGFTGVAVLAVPLFGLRQLYKTNWQLQKNSQDMLELMVAAIEARDPYTSGHSRRVARNAKIIARAIGLGAREVERVHVAALLHDVGKIYEVFAPILRKPDRLTPEEWAIMQTHPIKSAELVMKVSLLKDVVPPIRHHHENWDGSGYPDGIAGQAIPLGARIIMFADTIDAMLTDRPYRKAMTEAEVRSELARCRGTQFDPEICDRLMASPQFRLLFSPVGNPTPVINESYSLLKVV